MAHCYALGRFEGLCAKRFFSDFSEWGEMTIIEKLERRADYIPEPPRTGPTVTEMIAAIQAAMGKERYRLLLDAKRRPDGETITKSMVRCIEEMYAELKCPPSPKK